MTIVQKEPVYVCDICKNEFDKWDLSVNESIVSRISSIECEIYYQGFIKTGHICRKCSGKLLSFIHDIEPKIDYYKWVKQ